MKLGMQGPPFGELDRDIIALTASIHSPSRMVHVITALLTSLIGGIVIWYWPELIKDKATGLGTLGFFVTAYAAVFTIIEVIRAGNAALLAKDAARETAGRVEALHDARNAAECQTLIESALDRLNEEGTVSASSLARIVKLYVAEFSVSYAEETSPHREQVGMVNSYAFSFSQSKGVRLKNSDKLKASLVSMMAEVSASSARRTQGVSS